MWELNLIKLLFCSWPFVDINLNENSIFKTFIKYITIYVFIGLLEWGAAPTFATGPGSISPLSRPGL
jgi:hypothetical protein